MGSDGYDTISVSLEDVTLAFVGANAPQSDSGVSAAANCIGAIRGEGDAPDAEIVAGEDGTLLHGDEIPQADSFIAGAGEQKRVRGGGQGDAVDPSGVAVEDVNLV